MKDRLAEWVSGVKENSHLFEERFRGLDKDRLNWKPNPQKWSVGQNIDHLIQTSKSFYPNIEKINRGEYKKPFMGRIPFLVNFFERLVLKAIEPDNPRKTKTFPIWEPHQSSIEENILDQFLEEQDSLVSMFESSKDLIGKGIVIYSPASNKLVYSLEAAFDILVKHQRRHLKQAEKVLEARRAFP